MPSFTTANASMRVHGLIVEIGLMPGLMPVPQQPGVPVHIKAEDIVNLNAMIDTGASHTVVRTDIIEGLQLKSVGEIRTATPSTDGDLETCLQYLVNIQFKPNGVIVPNIVISAMPLKHQPVQCLIGRDILAQGTLFYNGYMNTFTLCH